MEDSANHDNNQVNNQEIKPIEFEVLTPSDSVDVSTHKAALDQAFLDAKLRNIAITGPYGSGKSSILKSYLKCQAEGCKEKGQKYEDKCLWISLSQLHPIKDGNLAANNDQSQKEGTSEKLAFQTEQVLEGNAGMCDRIGKLSCGFFHPKCGCDT